MEEEVYYVNVREPVQTRKNILETSRKVVLALQKYEAFKLRHDKKQDLVNRIRTNFKEINELISRLKKELPQVKLKKKVSVPEEKKPVTKKKAAKGKKELGDLEQELKDIEMKLKELK